MPSSPTILVVDDQADVRDILGRMLRRASCRVIEATNGAEGVERGIESSPDIILMDLTMPVMDGWEATRRIRAHPATAHVPVVALSGRVFERASAEEAGCNELCTKPITMRQLREVLDRYLPPTECIRPPIANRSTE
jgi:CheY-like chemotaxis protein